MLNDKRIKACMSCYDSGAYSPMQFLSAKQNFNVTPVFSPLILGTTFSTPAFSTPGLSTPALSTPAMSTPVIWCRVVHSRFFHPCHLVPRCQLPRFTPLQFRPCRVVHSRDFSRPPVREGRTDGQDLKCGFLGRPHRPALASANNKPKLYHLLLYLILRLYVT